MNARRIERAGFESVLLVICDKWLRGALLPGGVNLPVKVH